MPDFEVILLVFLSILEEVSYHLDLMSLLWLQADVERLRGDAEVTPNSQEASQATYSTVADSGDSVTQVLRQTPCPQIP